MCPEHLNVRRCYLTIILFRHYVVTIAGNFRVGVVLAVSVDI